MKLRLCGRGSKSLFIPNLCNGWTGVVSFTSLPLDLQDRKAWSLLQKRHLGHRKGLNALENTRTPCLFR
jgi:hypothetical protein